MKQDGRIGKRILILDGAMGTMLQQHGLTGNSEAFNLTHPEVIGAIHREYIDAGADIIETNTFSAHRISQRDHGMADQAAELARAGARIARQAADEAQARFAEDPAFPHRRVYVAGSIGPSNRSLTIAPDINDPARRDLDFDGMAAACLEEIEALAEGGVDLILLETCFDALNTKAALYAVQRWNEAHPDDPRAPMPVIVSVSVSDKSGRTLTGQTLEAFYTAVCHYPLTAFGMNCSLGSEDMAPLIREVARFCPVPVICYPNAGMPNEMGDYDEKPAQMAGNLRKIALKGSVDIVGGCCGSTPEHICAVATAMQDLPLSSRQSRLKRLETKDNGVLTVSGLEPVRIDARSSLFTNIGERTNVAGSRKFARLIAAGDYEAALQIAVRQIEDGARIIDINMDDAMLDSTACMTAFVRHIQNDPAVSRAALMIDSSHWETILAGLKNAQGKCIVNSISLKEGEAVFLEKARQIRALGAAMVVMAFDEKGQATTFDRKVEICRRAYRLLTGARIPPEEIIFDVNVLSVGTGIPEHDRYAVDFIEAVRWIKQNLPGAYTSGGISNLSFAFRGNNTVREAMHSAFLYHAIRAGLDMGIVNPGMLQVYDRIEPDLLRCVEDVILDRDPLATERLIRKASEIREAETSAPSPSAPEKAVQAPWTPSERLVEALVSGRADTLEADVLACLSQTGSAVQVIEGPLMTGMEQVGERFGEGKMFLPQVVKSAKVMKDAVAILEPYMQGSGQEQMAARPVIVNATVKGDVHDIGKNITGIVLSCNGFEVVDLGVMVDKETILDEAVRRGASLIGVSGLITPSLYQMEEICREMTARGMDIPLFIGGATTSAIHTALKLAPLYDHVFYSPDASAAAVMAKKCIRDRAAFEAEQHAGQERLRTQYAQRKSGHTPPVRSYSLFKAKAFLHADAVRLPDIPAREIPLAQLRKWMDWRMFLAVWGIRYKKTLPAQATDPKGYALLQEGKATLDRMEAEHQVSVRLSVRFAEAWSVGDDIHLTYRDGDKDTTFVLPMLRQEERQMLPTGFKGRFSLSDFVPDEAFGFRSPVGLFAVSVQQKGGHPAGCDCPACHNTYDRMMDRAVRVTLAEAASAWLNRRLRKCLNVAKIPDMRIARPAAGYACCPDHTLKADILRHLPGGDRLGITFTESYAMIPDASICGFIFIHTHAGYPEIHRIGKEQYDRYAAARGLSEEEARRFLGHLL